MVSLKSTELCRLLRNGVEAVPTHAVATAEDVEVAIGAPSVSSGMDSSGDLRGQCDVSYALFLEPADSHDHMTRFEYAIDQTIRFFSPAPGMVHVELVVPPIPHSDGGKIHFATYYGSHGANWQNRNDETSEGLDFYLLLNGAKWRAVPVFGADMANRLRDACDTNVNSAYALSMYPTSARPLRAFAWLWGDSPGHKGHCATLTSRTLRAAGVRGLVQPSAWYCPSSLFTTLTSHIGLAGGGVQEPGGLRGVSAAERASLESVDVDTCNATIEALLHAPLSHTAVRELGDAKCVDAIRHLTGRVVDTVGGDPMVARAAQKELATALLKWVLLRTPDTA